MPKTSYSNDEKPSSFSSLLISRRPVYCYTPGLEWLREQYEAKDTQNIIEYMPEFYLLPDHKNSTLACCFKGEYFLLSKSKTGFERLPLPEQDKAHLNDLIEKYIKEKSSPKNAP